MSLALPVALAPACQRGFPFHSATVLRLLAVVLLGLCSTVPVARGAACATDGSAGAKPPVAPHAYHREGPVMGTVVSFTAWTTEEAVAEKVFADAFEQLRQLDRMMTDWERPGQPPSDVVRINQAAGKHAVTVSPETIAVITASLEMSRKSEGAFDITFAALRGLWKFDEDLEKKIPPAAEIARRRRLINWRDVIVDPTANTVKLRRAGMKLGLGGIAKGYAVDRAAEVLRRSGLHDFMVQAGGDLYVSGSKGDKSWMVGIKDPRGERRDQYFAVAPIRDHAFSTAGDYERGFVLGGRRYHHIIDPKTGYPATASRSVTIFARTAFEADALDDAVFILGPDKGLALIEATPDAGAVIVDALNKVWVSQRLKGVVQLTGQPTDGI